MEHPRSAVQRQAGEETLEATKATTPRIDTIGEYSARYERGLGGKEGYEDGNLNYWLSEEEEETHQLKRRKWKSRLRKGTYVVQDARGPKLRPAEGS